MCLTSSLYHTQWLYFTSDLKSSNVGITNTRLLILVHSKITMVGDVVPYYTVTALVPTLK